MIDKIIERIAKFFFPVWIIYYSIKEIIKKMKLNIYKCKKCGKEFYIKSNGMNYSYLFCPSCQKRADLVEQEQKWEKIKR